MSQINIDIYNESVEVVFHGYRHYTDWKKWFCLSCFEKKHCEITNNNEPLYCDRNYIKLIQFSDIYHSEQSNYCTFCATPLYDIDTEKCLLLNPTLNKWLQRFNQKRDYGLRGGGTCRSTMQ